MLWLRHALLSNPQVSDDSKAAVRDWLTVLEARQASGSKKPLPYLPFGLVRLSNRDVDRATLLVERLIEAGGSGVAMTMDQLLALILANNHERLIPFWERTATPHHAFGRRDITVSMRASASGMALRVLMYGGIGAAGESLLRFIQSARPEQAGVQLARTIVMLTRADRVSEARPFLAIASDLAVNSKAFEVRYPARLALRAAGIDPPRDQPDGFFTFVVSYDEFTCSIELASDDTLTSLHHMIQRALRWDGDHMWCFYLADGEHRELFTWPSEEDLAPTWSDASLFPLDAASDRAGNTRPTHAEADGKRAKAMLAAIRAAAVEEREVIGTGPLSLDPLECIGEFGFRAAQSFVYHFDFSHGHRMKVKVGRPSPKRATGIKYPRVAESKGKRPSQYDW